MQMMPGVVTLSPLFLGLLRVSHTAAYALQPCFATRLDVYSVSAGSESCWVPCALLISQCGELYLFSAADGRVINAALLGQVAGVMDTDKARVDVVTQRMPGPGSDMQSLYVRCRQPLQPVNLCEKGKRSDSTTRRSEAVAESEATPSTVFPPFSYLMRFHCRNVPVVLQLLRIITVFADPDKGELFIRQAQVPLKEELDFSIFVDPLDTTPREQNKHAVRIRCIDGAASSETCTRLRNFFFLRKQRTWCICEMWQRQQKSACWTPVLALKCPRRWTQLPF
ncbi:hypothetical protein TraAM80_03201 [Trypanosoma rangeli]|uniref:Sema domain-containing protein n=1 Tax=Trypanosoma rangeli TaxID=5698 RepID=A0A3R7NU08_TRYRA|nr:uncharacterized protein TraAM80_03201 [Trypanosoma rangeli]RNF07679.1 hypothetical protein TraAM80_03201 [Trypanosoma rangeli]|eukprot:RNF07679.1 hypothetical protein TraAM80_03201 [Trypanosoma rangeli]